jgi:hypothetical protein
MASIQQNTEVQCFSLNDLDIVDGKVINTLNSEDFDVESYSRFKYGDASVARSYANDLAEQVVDNYPEGIDDLYIASSAYKQVPTAAYYISHLLLSSLAAREYVPEGVFRIDRGIIFGHDYATLNEKERQEVMANNGLEVSQSARQELEGKEVLIVDDIRVTGKHEESLTQALGGIGLKKLAFGYVAVIEKEAAKEHPEMEDFINSSAVKSIADLVPIIESGQFYLNARTCKFILQHTLGEIEEFFRSIPEDVTRTITASIIADGYHKMGKFASKFSTISNAIR